MLRYTTPHHTTRHDTTLHYTNHNYSYNYKYATLTLRYTRVHYITLPCITLRYTHYTTIVIIFPRGRFITLHSLQMQLQPHCTNYITPQLQLHYTTATTTAPLHQTTSSSCGWGDWPGDHCNHCNYSQKHNSNHLWVHQWIRSAVPWFTTTNLSYRFPIFETSATALCSTTGHPSRFIDDLLMMNWGLYSLGMINLDWKSSIEFDDVPSYTILFEDIQVPYDICLEGIQVCLRWLVCFQFLVMVQGFAYYLRWWSQLKPRLYSWNESLFPKES